MGVSTRMAVSSRGGLPRLGLILAVSLGLLFFGLPAQPAPAVAPPGADASEGLAELRLALPSDKAPAANQEAEDRVGLEAKEIRSFGDDLGAPDSVGRVRVEIVHAPKAAGAVRTEVGRLGGEVLGVSPGVVLVEVLPERVAELWDRADVLDIRSPLRVDLLPGPIQPATTLLATPETHVSLTNAAAWQDAGHLGGGVKVGIVDFFNGTEWSAAEASGDVPGPAGTFCQYQGSVCDIWTASSKHGVAVAEIVHDMSPGATLYLATVGTVTELGEAVAWFDAQGVQIITRSLGSELDGPGDGTGSVDAIVDDAVGRGMVWFNAAGNHASESGTDNGGYWRSDFDDVDTDGWMEFGPGDEALAFVCGYIQGFRWSDWQANDRSDYDIYITDLTSGVELARSTRNQMTGATPLEWIEPEEIDCGAHPILNLWVNLYDAGSGTSGDILEFMVNGTAFEYSSNPYSASQPAADSANSGMVAVGAIDPPTGTLIASYSSQGPTNDERIKPDLSAPSCLPSVAYEPACFDGTSAATPVVAGAAALVWGAGVATTPQDVAQYLHDHVIDRGGVGPDSVYGSGQLYLGDPPVLVNQPPVVSAGSNQTVTLPSGASLNGTVTDDGLPTGSLSSTWSKVSGPGSVTFANVSAVDTVATFGSPGVYVLRLSATDGALSSSDDVTITVDAEPPPLNEAPLVSAGSNLTVTLPSGALLGGTVTDDGLPSGALSSTWSKLSGPGSITFVNVSEPNTEAIFSTSGTYVARLSATDGALSSSDDVTITVKPVPPPPDLFNDDVGSVFEADINWLASSGITMGCNPPTNDRFCPNAAVTRGQMAAFLVRGLHLVDQLNDPFLDDDGSVFEADIEKLAAAGITMGCNPPVNDRFCPNATVTREQMAAFLVRALGYTDDGGGDLFIDDDASIFESDIDRLGSAGVTAGCNPPTNSLFCPKANVTRGQMAAFLHRALG